MIALQKIIQGCLKVSPLILIILFLFLIITYWKVPAIFFLQDDWQTVGLVISEGQSMILRGLGDSRIFHFLPIDNLLNYLSYTIFGLHNQPYNIVALLIHFINALLVLRLAKKIFNDQTIAIIASVIFITSSISNQLIMWPVVSLNTLSLTFTLLAWITLLNFPSANKSRLGIMVSLLILLAILTLEYSVGLLIFIPLSTAMLFYKKGEAKNLLMIIIPIFILTLLYISLRLYPVIINQSAEYSTKIVEANALFYKIIRYPIRYIGQTFIPQTVIHDLSGILSENTQKPLEFFFSKVTFTSGIFFLLIFLLLGWVNEYKLKAKNFFKKELMLILFLLCSSAPFLLIPGEDGNFLLYPPRYLYFGLVSTSLLSASLLVLLKTKKRLLLILISSLLLVDVVYNIRGNLIKSNELYEESEIRLSILNTIKSQYPTLAKKSVFYTESDSSFYGITASERILPFQSGFGQTLLVWYDPVMDFPKDFFKNKFLWGITDQGYKEVNDVGYGYFRDFDLLTKAIEENNIPLNGIISFSYDSENKELRKTSEEIVGRLEGFFIEKKKIVQGDFTATTSNNTQEIRFALDQKRETYWDSKIPYAQPQFIEIDLKTQRKLAQVTIDSYNNKDQNEVGYIVWLSDDKNNLRSVFRSKKYPPNENGFVDFYFLPQKARYIKIEQIGSQKYATWVIHELNIYEVLD